MSVRSATIHFNQHGTPVASEFDDVYFSNASGIQESEYVFIQNNHLLERWQAWPESTFTIAETGFGTGLNFLVTLVHFKDFRRAHPNHPLQRLYFISVEKFPIEKPSLSKALEAWPQLAQESAALLQQYQLDTSGCHRMLFNRNSTILDIWVGDVEEVLPAIDSHHNGQVDAWFLDGFAPSKNPQMWGKPLFTHMARLSKEDATFATFTAAGLVKRGLAEVGFSVEKRPGFGRKRDMLAGKISVPGSSQVSGLFCRTGLSCPPKVKTIAVIGAGLAAANCALALVNKGFQVELYCRSKAIADGASGNPQGGFYPLLNASASIASQLHVSAFHFALRHYRDLLAKGYHFNHQWCGVLLPAFSQAVRQRQQKLIDNHTWPTDLVTWLDEQEASHISGVHMPYPGLFIPQAGWINPKQLVAAMLDAALASGRLTVHTEQQLVDAEFHQGSVCLDFCDKSIQTDAVVFACGHQSSELDFLADLPMRLVRGQVEHIQSTGELQHLNTVICHKGYLTPAQNGAHAMGSTYVKQDVDTRYRLAETATNLRVLRSSLAKCDWVGRVNTQGSSGRAAIRCSTPDHLPMVGALPDLEAQRQQYMELYKGVHYKQWPEAKNHPNAFLLTGLGSRGLTTSPLLAEVLACQINGEPLPLSMQLLAALNPNRFLIRELLRRQP